MATPLNQFDPKMLHPEAGVDLSPQTSAQLKGNADTKAP
jgi:hypothetical protein